MDSAYIMGWAIPDGIEGGFSITFKGHIGYDEGMSRVICDTYRAIWRPVSRQEWIVNALRVVTQ